MKTMVLLFAMSTLVACSSVSPIKKESRSISLDSAANAFAKMMRWGYFDEAASYVRSKDGTPFEVTLDMVARHRVTSYKNTIILLADNGAEGRVVASIEYYEIDSGVLRTLRDEQAWWYDVQSERWYLGSGLPPMGVVKEAG